MFWKKKIKCSECGKVHSEWPALTFKSPTNYHFLSDQEKSELGKLDPSSFSYQLLLKGYSF